MRNCGALWPANGAIGNGPLRQRQRRIFERCLGRIGLEPRAAQPRDEVALLVIEPEVGKDRPVVELGDVDGGARRDSGFQQPRIGDTHRHVGSRVVGIREQHDQSVEAGVEPRGIDHKALRRARRDEIDDDEILAVLQHGVDLTEGRAEIERRIRGELVGARRCETLAAFALAQRLEVGLLGCA